MIYITPPPRSAERDQAGREWKNLLPDDAGVSAGVGAAVPAQADPTHHHQ